MPQGLSSTPLPATAVHRAASRALDALFEERRGLKVALIAEYRLASRGWAWLRADEAVWDRLPPDRRAVYDNHRSKDEKVLCALRSLCAAATAYNPSFTVIVTADDFRLLASYYKT